MSTTPSYAVPRSADAFDALPQSDCICARLLGAANTPETITIPTNADRVLLAAAGGDFVALFGPAGATTAALPSDKDDGSQAGEINPTMRKIRTTDKVISVISFAANVYVTASFYLKPGAETA